MLALPGAQPLYYYYVLGWSWLPISSLMTLAYSHLTTNVLNNNHHHHLQASTSQQASQSNIANSFVSVHFQLLFNGSNQYIDNEVQVKIISFNSMQRKIVIIVKCKI